MKLLLRASSLVHAAHCSNVLRAAGIEAELRNTWLAGAAGDIPFQESSPQVWIADAANETEAWAILNAAANPAPGPRWRCAHCDEWHEAQFAACWRCGTMKEG